MKTLASNRISSYNYCMKLRTSQKLYEQMEEGKVYRRDELSKLCSSVDRELKELVDAGLVSKPAVGLYYRPAKSKWGDVPASAEELIRAFLKTGDFLLTSTNAYNSLSLGLTQLSNVALVYNRRRVGRVKLGSLWYEFKHPVNYPKKLDKEFLYVDLLNNMDMLPEKSEELEAALKRRLEEESPEKLRKYAELYGKRSTQKKLNEFLKNVA